MRLSAIVGFALIIVLLASQAQAGCGRWVVRTPETDFLEDPTFDEAIASSTGPTATAGEGVKANGDGNSNSDNNANVAANSDVDTKAAEKSSDENLDVSGNWLVHLDNMDDSTLNLILIQSKDRLQGYGSLKDKDAEVPATTTGSISEDALSLSIKLVKDGAIIKDDRQYKLSIALSEKDLEKGKLDGQYEYYLSDELKSEGNVTATKA